LDGIPDTTGITESVMRDLAIAENAVSGSAERVAALSGTVTSAR